MTEINKQDIARIVGHDEDSEHLKKEASIIKDKVQYSVRIPMKFAKLANINPEKDKFEFTLIPIGEKKGEEFTIEADLKKG